MTDVFISYSRKDKTTVLKFYETFKENGISAWMDIDGIETGDAFKERIVDAISNAELFLFFSSKDSNESEWTVKEVGVANSYKKPIIPIKLDDSQYAKSILFDLVNISYIDYTKPSLREVCMTTLLKEIKNRVTRKGSDEFLYCPKCHSNNLRVKLQNADMENKRAKLQAEKGGTLASIAVGGAGAALVAGLVAPSVIPIMAVGTAVASKIGLGKAKAVKEQANIVFTCSDCGKVFDLSDAGIAHK